MLAQFALLAFGLFAMMSLAIDVGYVTLTRVQMQNAAEAAAIEGMRQRDVLADDGAVSDCVRRQAARDVVGWTFDDDFEVAADERQFGAGPDIGLEGGEGSVAAFQTLVIRDPRVYKPRLQLNQPNQQHGDLVSGHYSPLAPAEDSGYARSDFVPGMMIGSAECDPVPEPSPGSGPITDDAFLVRLRRTNDLDGLDELPAISSRGPAVPLLFGRGALIGGDPDEDYLPRVHGLTVRATSIAQARPALRVGPPPLVASDLGAAPFDLQLDLAKVLGVPLPAVIDSSDGSIRFNGAMCEPLEPGRCGAFVSVPASIVTVGDQRLAPAGAPACDPMATPGANTISGYASVYDAIGASSTRRIIGFVRVALSWPDCPGAPESITLTLRGRVAPANASVALPGGWPGDVPPVDRPEVLLKNRTLDDDATGVHVALLAPVIVR
jgi:hypothetical protein